MGPALSEHYALITLPRIPDVPLAEKVVTPVIRTTNASEIDLGVSKSIISSYLLKPTPKLVWSYPLSPSTVVDSMDVKDKETKQYIIGLTERRKHKVLYISRNEEDAATEEVSLPSKAKGLWFTKSAKSFYVVTQSGDVHLFKVENGISPVETKIEPNKAAMHIYHAFVYENNKQLLVLVSKVKGGVQYRLLSLDEERSFEVSNIIVKEDTNLRFCYSHGTLYKLSIKNKSISSHPLSRLDSETKTVDVGALMQGRCSEVSMHLPSPERIVLSYNNSISLLNFQFESLLDHMTGDGELYVNTVVATRGDTATTTDTFALYLDYDKALNNVELKIVNVNVGFNRLSECLGKSITKVAAHGFKGLPSLLNDAINDEEKQNAKQFKSVFEKLGKLRARKSSDEFSTMLVKFLKNDTKGETFDEAHDRIVDVNFVKQVLGLIFTNEDGLEFQDSAFVPEGALTYLFTHPCFAHEYSHGLLQLLHRHSQQKLLRQAIITCPALSIDELLSQFINIDDHDDTLNDVIHRLVTEYSINDITASFQKYVRLHEASINLNQVLSKLVSVNTGESLQLLQVVIDVGGLFNWLVNTIKTLETIVEAKVEALIANNFNLTLTNQALAQTPTKTKKKKVDNIIASDTHQQQQLESILTISDPLAKKFDEPVEVSKVPKYSVEKLVL